MQAAVRDVGQQVVVLGAAADRDFAPGFATLAERGVNALIVLPDPFLDSHREALVSLAARYAIPAMYQWREFVQTGGLVSYGSSLTDAHRQLGNYTGEVLQRRPADLPVLQPANSNSSSISRPPDAWAVTVPTSILLLADEVIESVTHRLFVRPWRMKTDANLWLICVFRSNSRTRWAHGRLFSL